MIVRPGRYGGGMAKFKSGDKVQLNIGGPAMSVVCYTSMKANVRCTWFAGKKHEEGDFAESTLVPYVEPKGKAKAESDDDE